MTRPDLTPAQVLETLRTHVHIDGDCRLWAGWLRDGRPSHRWLGSQRYVRRTLLELTGRPVPVKHAVWTSCGHILCVAEEHLQVGTRRQMMQAAARRGSFQRGAAPALRAALARAPRARLPITRAREAAQLRLEGRTWAEIGAHFGITGQSACNALTRWERAGLLQWGAL